MSRSKIPFETEFPAPPSGSTGTGQRVSEVGALDTALFDQMEECVTVCRCDATCLYLNTAAERLLGRPREALVGRSLWEVSPELVGGPFHQVFQRVAETGQREEFEHPAAPGTRWFANRIIRSGERVYVFARELSSGRIRNDALRLHLCILERMTEGVNVTDAQGVIVYTNPAQDRMFGYAPGELLGKHVSVLNDCPPEKNRQLVDEILSRLEREGTWAGELRNLRKDGTSFFTEARISVLHLGGGPHWVWLQRDVTEQRRLDAERAEYDRRATRLYEETRRAEQRAAFLAEAGELLASSLDREQIMHRLARLAVPTLADWCAVDVPTPDGRVRRVVVVHESPERVAQTYAFHVKYPITLDDPHGTGKVLRTGVPELVPELTEEILVQTVLDAEKRRAVRELGINGYIVVPLISRERVLGAFSLVIGESGRRYTGADLRFAEELARRAAASLDNGLLYKEAQDAIRARDTFLTVASHELNTPLTSLRLNVQALQRAFRQQPSGALPPDVISSRFQVVQRQITRLSTLVRELLDVSRITLGKLKLECEDVELTALVHDVLLRFSDELARAGCELRLFLSEPVMGHWDRLRVEQILQNLLSNAIKYGQGKPIEVRSGADGQRAWLSVRDQGIGIPPEDQARLFQRFERLVSERNYGGFGLGLWIVKQSVDAMEGRIQVESEPGQGSVFTVWLPLRPGSCAT